MLKVLRRFRWKNLPKRQRQLTALTVVVGATTATMNYKFKECIEIVGNPAEISNPNTLFWLRMVYGRMRSRWFGAMAEVHVPVALRQSLYSLFAWRYNADLEEVRYPLESFRSFQDFFCRSLKTGSRPIADVPEGLVCPVDATVLKAETLDCPLGRVEQVKGATFSVTSLLGSDPSRSLGAKSKLQYVVLYLAPGKYHRIHAPCALEFDSGKHFAGELLPVRTGFLQWMPDVFSVNERVILSGTWKQGQIHVVPVGAANVGNIYLDFDEKLKTNRLRDVVWHCGGDVSEKKFVPPASLQPGEHLGGFRMGSTVVIVFESSADFEWRVAPGDEVRVGQPLGESRLV